jgi:hypothetical protein
MEPQRATAFYILYGKSPTMVYVFASHRAQVMAHWMSENMN